jgi:hypothetical protein
MLSNSVPYLGHTEEQLARSPTLLLCSTCTKCIKGTHNKGVIFLHSFVCCCCRVSIKFRAWVLHHKKLLRDDPPHRYITGFSKRTSSNFSRTAHRIQIRT